MRKLTKCRQIAVLTVQKEKIDGDLLTGAFKRETLVEVSSWSEMLNVFR
jgi:hypothetical protein